MLRITIQEVENGWFLTCSTAKETHQRICKTQKEVEPQIIRWMNTLGSGRNYI